MNRERTRKRLDERLASVESMLATLVRNTTDLDGITARDLLTTGTCTAACLLALADEPCTCRCNGQYHGALKDAGVIETCVEAAQRSDPVEWPKPIGDVLELLQPEFPDLRISKIRFLEGAGLVNPLRSGGGFRRYAESDVDQLRWVLIQQRDHYLPLDVIQQRLTDYLSTTEVAS